MATNDSTLGLSDLRLAVVRHKKKAFATFCLIVIVAAAVAVLAPKRYHSGSLLLVRLGKENATLDPTVTLGPEPVVAVPASREGELNSIVEIVKSRATAEKVVDALGVDFILGRSVATENTAQPEGWIAQCRSQLRRTWSQCKEQFRRLEGTAALPDRELAVLEVLSRSNAAPLRKSELIQIDCKGPSPQWCQKVVAALTEVCQAEHMRLNRPNQSLEFFAAQTERTRRELLEKRERLRDLKTASVVFSPADQRQNFAARLSRLEEERLQSQAASKMSETRVAALRQQLDSLPAEQVESVTTGIGNEGTDQMRGQLYQLEVRQKEAAAKYTDAHPAKQALDEQLQASRAIAEKQAPTRTHVATGQSRIHQETQAALLQEQALLAGSRTKDNVLDSQLAALRGQVKDFNQQELAVAALEGDIEVCDATYRKYAAGMEQAKIDQARETARISNIAVAQPATLEPEIVFPNRTMCMEFGVLFGLVAAMAVAFWAEVRNHSFRGPEDIQRRLGIMVLATIPDYHAAEPLAAVRRRS